MKSRIFVNKITIDDDGAIIVGEIKKFYLCNIIYECKQEDFTNKF